MFSAPTLLPRHAAQMADFHSLHMPLTPGTKNLFGDSAFAKIKKGSRIINVARGGVIDEQALLRALESKAVAQAALDVFMDEPPKFDGEAGGGGAQPQRPHLRSLGALYWHLAPLPPPQTPPLLPCSPAPPPNPPTRTHALPPAGHPLVGRSDVIVTPHLGASTTEAQEGVAIEVVEAVVDALAGKLSANAVNAPMVPPEILKVRCGAGGGEGGGGRQGLGLGLGWCRV